MKKYLSLAIIILAIWLPRGLALDRFVTPDEPKWLTRSANFYLALAQTDFASTYQKEHPGVTVMWAGTAGFLSQYRGYVFGGPGQQDRPQKFERYLDKQGMDVLSLLVAGRIFVILGITTALSLAYLLAVRLLGILPAFVGFLVIAFDPFLIALSRLLHLDGLVSALMLLALLAWLNYLFNGRRSLDLILSGAAAGLSWLTKSPALFLLPFLALTGLIEIGRTWLHDRRFIWADVWALLRAGLLWTAIGAVVFVALWPAMWVDPIGTLRQLFTGAAAYASEGHDSITFFNNTIYGAGISDWRFYPVSYFWRATPVVLIGLALLLAAAALRQRFPLTRQQRLTCLYLASFAVMFTLFMTTSAKKFDRYLLPVFAPLDLMAGLGWVAVLGKLSQRAPRAEVAANQRRPWPKPIGIILLVGILSLQALSALQTFPYFFSYYNPLAGGSARAPQVMMIGWGEGLDQAARYLNEKPDAEKLKVATWYPDGSFSYIFTGETIQRDLPETPKELKRADYLVLYAHQWQRQLPSQQFLDYFASITPEHVVTIDGLEYARIYHLR